MEAISQIHEKWQSVCNTSSLRQNSGICALVGDKHIAIFKVKVDKESQLYAIDNIDPFAKASVLARGIVGDLDGELYVASPLLKQRFSLSDGHCLDDDTVKLETYAVRETSGTIEILC